MCWNKEVQIDIRINGTNDSIFSGEKDFWDSINLEEKELNIWDEMEFIRYIRDENRSRTQTNIKQYTLT